MATELFPHLTRRHFVLLLAGHLQTKNTQIRWPLSTDTAGRLDHLMASGCSSNAPQVCSFSLLALGHLWITRLSLLWFGSNQAITGAGAVPEAPVKLKLYSFWRSSCSQRVRIALNLKGTPLHPHDSVRPATRMSLSTCFRSSVSWT